MKPIGIPLEWADESQGEYVREVQGAGSVGSCWALIRAPHGEPERFDMLVELDETDLEEIAKSKHLWIGFWGSHLHPWAVSAAEIVPEPVKESGICGHVWKATEHELESCSKPEGHQMPHGRTVRRKCLSSYVHWRMGAVRCSLWRDHAGDHRALEGVVWVESDV